MTVNRLIQKEDAEKLHDLHSKQKYEEAGERKQYNFEKEQETSETFYSLAVDLGLNILEAEAISWFVWSSKSKLPDILDVEYILTIHRMEHE